MQDAMPITTRQPHIGSTRDGPEACGGGRQHHQADRQQRAERLEAADEVEHDEAEEDEMHGAAQPADRAQEQRIQAFGDQRAPEHDEA